MIEDIILQSIAQKVMTEMNTWLARPLSIIEIWEGLFELDVDSFLIIDGLTPHSPISGRETPDKIQGHELRNNEEPTTTSMAIQVLAYTCRKWIVDTDPIKVQP